MLRRLRWLLVVALFFTVAFVAKTYREQKAQLKREAPKASTPLPDYLSASFSGGWNWEKKDGDRTVVNVRAKTLEQIKEPANFLLKDLEMKLYNKDGVRYDLVRSASASFDTAAGTMYSDGEVEITMGLKDQKEPDEPVKPGRLVTIHTSGVTFDTKATVATTERHATFELDTGNGEAVGANYDANLRELHLSNAVKLNWQGMTKDAKPMMVEAGELIYKESDQLVLLYPWARLKRDTLTLETANATVFIKEGTIEHVEGQAAHGKDELPGKKVDYSAVSLNMFFTAKGEVTKVEGIGQARVVSTSAAAITTMTSDRIDLEFDSDKPESELKKALGTGKTRVESQPIARPGVAPADTRILTSEIVELNMRAGGKEIDKVVTHSPGTVEFVPNRPGQKKRQMDAERLTFTYGADNALQSVRAVYVKTKTDSEQKGKPVVTLTTSRDLQADFDPKTGQLATLDQWGDFNYEEGTRRAKADKARLDQAQDIIHLTTGARVWDETGSTTADEIELRQKSGEMTAKGNVASTRLPDQKPSPNQSGMISSSEPMQARAPVMITSNNNKRIRYEGGALLWQGASRINGDTVTIDRDESILEAHGRVVTQFPDSAQQGAQGKSNVFTVIRSTDLTYSDKDKVALYTGGVTLERPNTEVKSKQLRAYFREEKTPTSKESKLDRLLAEGAVDVMQRTPDRTRHGQAESGDYLLEEEKMVLSGGNPIFNDSRKGVTRGAVLTWFSRQDRLIVDNTGSGPAVTRIQRSER